MIVLVLLLGLALGAVLAHLLPWQIPLAWVRYSTLIILVLIDAVFDGLRAHLQEEFALAGFWVSFFSHALGAVFLVYLGDLMGVELYTAIAVVFSIRLFSNLSRIRKEFFKKKHF